MRFSYFQCAIIRFELLKTSYSGFLLYFFIRQSKCNRRIDLLLISNVLNLNSINFWLYPRACLKNHSRDLHSPLCGEFIPNLVNIARYDSWIWDKFSTNCEAHLTESIFQTRSSILVVKLQISYDCENINNNKTKIVEEFSMNREQRRREAKEQRRVNSKKNFVYAGMKEISID